MVKYGILDYAQMDEGSNASEALHDTVKLAQLADRLGYDRFWVTEHHNVPAFACSSPELVMMRLADATERIRIGSGGVMMPHYSPYKVAENFRTLEAFHAGRIDLGIGNNPGTAIVNKVLNENKQGKLDYEQSFVDLMKYLRDAKDANHRFNEITANPVVPRLLQVWVLSTSVRSAKMAAKLGIGYTLGLFPIAGMEHILSNAVKAAKTYREAFEPSLFMSKPTVSIAPFVVVAETNERAEEYAKVLDYWSLGKESYSYYPSFPSIETARKYVYTEKEKEIVQVNRKQMIVGNVERVTKQINEWIEQFHADEVLFLPLLPGIEARKKAIELLAEAFIHNR